MTTLWNATQELPLVSLEDVSPEFAEDFLAEDFFGVASTSVLSVALSEELDGLLR